MTPWHREFTTCNSGSIKIPVTRKLKPSSVWWVCTDVPILFSKRDRCHKYQFIKAELHKWKEKKNKRKNRAFLTSLSIYLISCSWFSLRVLRMLHFVVLTTLSWMLASAMVLRTPFIGKTSLLLKEGSLWIFKEGCYSKLFRCQRWGASLHDKTLDFPLSYPSFW